MNKQKQAFTLMELIITIIILAILWTIAFIALQWYSTSARDSTRITDLSSMRSSLEIYKVESWKYPKPTDWVDITYNWAIVWNQGTFWENVKVNTDKLNKIPLDPLSESFYTYSLTAKWNEYQLWWILEWDDVSLNDWKILPKTNASWEVIAKAYVLWTYNWLLTKAVAEWSCNILAVPSIITNDLYLRELQQIVDNNAFVYRWYRNLPSTYKSSKFNVYWWLAFKPNKLVVYSDSIWCEDLVNMTNHVSKLNLLKSLQDAYVWTILQNEWEINNIVHENININKTSNSTLSLSINTVNNTLWWNVALPHSTRNLPNCGDKPDYAWAIFTNWNPTVFNQSWQSLDSNAACYFTCWAWKVLYWNACIVENCTENLPLWLTPNGTSSVSNASTMYWWAWTYSATPWDCTFSCNPVWYNWNWSSCVINTYTVSWTLWIAWAWASVDLWWTTVVADGSWNFTSSINHGTSLSDINVTKTWYTCLIDVAWPSSLSWNFSNISWWCVINKYTVAWNFWVLAANAIINLWWTQVIANSVWWFSAELDYGTVLNNITVTKTWATCTVTTNWPINLNGNVTNISWSCNIATYTVSWSFWANWWWATINVCWQTLSADTNWNFSTTRAYLSDCSNITASKVWYVCTTTTQWSSGLSSNTTNIAWNCIVHTYTCNTATRPTNASTYTWSPTSDNQARQSGNPTQPCYFKCSVGYGSTWTSCVAVTYCYPWLKELTITWWQTRSCLNAWATEVWDWAMPYDCSWTWCTTNTPAWMWNFYAWWDNTPRTIWVPWRTTTLYSWTTNTPCEAWRHIPSEAEMDYTCTKLTWSVNGCIPFNSAISSVFIYKLKFWLLWTSPHYGWAHWTSQWKPTNSAYTISYAQWWVVLTNNYWTTSIVRVRCIK